MMRNTGNGGQATENGSQSKCGPILSASAVAEAGVLAADVCRVLRQSAEMFGLLAESHEALRAALARQTAALAAIRAVTESFSPWSGSEAWELADAALRGGAAE